MNALTAKLQLSATVETLGHLINSQYNWFYADESNLTEEEKSQLVKACMLYANLTGSRKFKGIECAVSEKLEEPINLFI